MTTPSIVLEPPRPVRGPSLTFPLILISVGALILLVNIGYIDNFSFPRLLQLWPMIFVLVGVELLVRDRSAALAFLLEIAIIVGAVAYAVAGPTTLVPIGTSTTTVGRQNAQSLALVLNYGAGELALHGGAAALVEVASSREDVRVQNVTHTGTAASVTVSPTDETFLVGGERRWEVAVPSDIPVTLTVNVGAGTFTLDLRDVKLRSARISNGASQLVVRLPAPAGDVPVTVSTGASTITFEFPPATAYRVRTTGGLNTVNGTEETSTYGAAADRYTVTVSAGMSTITIR